jgi:NAD(P)-dependent dehydrogenase (short-subunit alcohol dehydrogenase family)
VNILITGSARGLGLGLCMVATRRGDTVFAACRKPSEALQQLGVRIVEGIDVAEPASAARLRAALKGVTLDAVVCNAGINISYRSKDFDSLDLADVLEEYRVNTVGCARTVQAVLPNLEPGSKIGLITTSGGTLGRNPLRLGSYGYRMSKAGINTFGFLLASEVKPRGIAVRIISPGPVDTDMTRDITGAGVVTANKPGQMPDIVTAGNKVLSQLDELTLEDTGSWIDEKGKRWA